MTSNPLADRVGAKPGNVTVEKLEELAESLNKEPFARGLNRQYFVSREPNPHYDPSKIELKHRRFIHQLAWRNRAA
jgi:hypothetical protein